MALPLQSLVHAYLQSDTDWRKRLMQEWPTMVGDLHTKMRLERIGQDATLIIGVYDIHWMQELHMLTPLIMQTINEKLGSDCVKKIRFKVADAATLHKAPSQATVLNHEDKKVQAVIQSLTPEQQKALAALKDPGMQAALAKLWSRTQS